MIDAVAIVSVPVTNQLAAKRFYTDVLGFDLLRDNPMGPNRQWVQVGPRGARTSFTLVTWFDSMPAGVLAGIVLETTDLVAEVATLKARGLVTSEIQGAPWGQFVTFEDPDGNGFVLQQTAPSAR